MEKAKYPPPDAPEGSQMEKVKLNDKEISKWLLGGILQLAKLNLSTKFEICLKFKQEISYL
jgi:hypothetical protein